MLILPTGGMGIGVEANGKNFPFVQPSPEIRGLLADLWLAHEQDAVPPLRVSRMAGLQQAFDGLPSAVEITIVDAEGATVFDWPNASYYWKDWGARLRVHEWLHGDSVCRIVQHRATANPVPPWPDEILPVNGVLDERASERMAERLTILSEASTGQAATGEVVFAAGWNVVIAPAPYPEPLRNTTRLTFTADPGDGPGRYPGCQDPALVLRTINGIGPDTQGNFALAAGDCYYARQPIAIVGGLAVPTASTLLLGNDCGPCCDCDDFVAVQKAILNVEAGLRAAAAIAEATRDEFIVAKDRWNEGKKCREQQAVTVVAATTARAYADINATVCNVTTGCLLDSQLMLTVDSNPRGSWSVVPGTTFISYAGKSVMVPYQMAGPTGQDNLSLYAYFDAINPRSAGRLSTRLVWSGPLPVGTVLTVTGTAHAADPLFPQSGTFTTLMT